MQMQSADQVRANSYIHNLRLSFQDPWREAAQKKNSKDMSNIIQLSAGDDRSKFRGDTITIMVRTMEALANRTITTKHNTSNVPSDRT